MHYDFDQLINRRHTASKKWDGMKGIFGEDLLLPMWVADMDFRSPLPVIESMKHRVEHGIFGYNDRPDSYYEAITDWMNTRFQWPIRREWICFSPGVLPAISLLINQLTEPGDPIVIQPPVYAPFFQVVTKNRRQLVTNPLRLENGRYLIDFEDLERKLDSGVKVLILCSPHNPVGRVWTREELTHLGEMCLKRKVLIISDEIHADLVFQGNHHTPFVAISEEFAQNSIVCTAPSKTFNIPGLQTANIIIPNEKLRRVFQSAINNHFLNYSNTFGLVATESAYRFGSEWLEQCLTYIQQNLDYLTEYLEAYLPEIQVIHPEGTFLAWLDCRGLGFSGKCLEELMLTQAKVAFVAGHTFGMEGEGFLRINLATPQILLEEALNRVENAIRRMDSSR